MLLRDRDFDRCH